MLHYVTLCYCRRRAYTRRGRATAGQTGDYLYRVVYEDGDAEEMGEIDVRKILIVKKCWRKGDQDSVAMYPEEVAATPAKLFQEVDRRGAGAKRKAVQTANETSTDSPRKAPRVVPTVAPKPVPARSDSTLSKNLVQALSFLQTMPSSGAPRGINTAAVFKTKYT